MFGKKQTMKLTGLIRTVLAAIVVVTLGCSTNSPTAQTQKPGKALVRSLPSGIQGVELVGNTVRVKPGFKWVKQPNGTVTVARIAGGTRFGEGGTWSCDCTTGPYRGCQAEIKENSLQCAPSGGDCLSCKLTTTKSGVRTHIIAY